VSVAAEAVPRVAVNDKDKVDAEVAVKHPADVRVRNPRGYGCGIVGVIVHAREHPRVAQSVKDAHRIDDKGVRSGGAVVHALLEKADDVVLPQRLPKRVLRPAVQREEIAAGDPERWVRMPLLYALPEERDHGLFGRERSTLLALPDPAEVGQRVAFQFANFNGEIALQRGFLQIEPALDGGGELALGGARVATARAQARDLPAQIADHRVELARRRDSQPLDFPPRV